MPPMKPKKAKKNMTETREFICGFALGITEVYRNNGDARKACVSAGLSFSEFIQAGVPDYDIETLEEIFSEED